MATKRPDNPELGRKSSSPESEMTAYLFVDTFAFETLAAQPECVVKQRGATITGYETYMIEQWACERKVNTVVTSYTGNSKHVVEVQILLVPTNLEQWSPVTFAHFEELVRMHILPKETPLGNMLVTSLSTLPSNLTLVSIPSRFMDGMPWFVVNEDLRRLSVAGRSAVTADVPGESVIANFRRSFLVANSVPAEYAVKELVTLVQISLYYFGLLPSRYVDGFLCSYTLKATETWWSTFGRQRFRVPISRPQDKLYMRTTCTALIGLVTGARQRLSALGLKPPKDPFDPENFVECIRRFQKLAKLPRTMLLDEATYSKLVHETAKLSSLGGTSVLNVMKSTVKEGLSGKVAGGVEDWETIDLEVLAANVRGHRAQYLWLGKSVGNVPHIQSASLCQSVGAKTQIPEFSLTHEAAPSGGSGSAGSHQHHHHQHHRSSSSISHPSSLPHHPPQNVTPASKKAPQLQPSSHPVTAPREGGARAAREPNDTSPRKWSKEDIQELDEAGTPSDSHVSLVHRFRKRSQPQQAHSPPRQVLLAEAFDESFNHRRNLSTSSDNWFAKGPSPFTTPYAHHRPDDFAIDDALTEDDDMPIVHTNGSKPAAKESSGLTRKPDSSPLDQSDHVSASHLLTRDDLDIRRNDTQAQLRRTSSFSQVESLIFAWDPLASMPKIVRLFEEARSLQHKVSDRMQRDHEVATSLASRISKNEKALGVVQRDNVLINYHVNAAVKKEEAVRRRARELEAFMARLDYEVAMLSVKLRDVVQSVMSFAEKVDSMEKKWNSIKSLQLRPWWVRWMFFLKN